MKEICPAYWFCTGVQDCSLIHYICTQNYSIGLERKIRVGAVSYLNTKPLIYGFEKGLMADEVELVMDYPSKIAAMLQGDEIDIGLLPVAAVMDLDEYYLISDYCIAANGPVASVCLFSHIPLEEITEIFLDYQSRTSAALLRILCLEYWKIKPKFMEASANYIKEISNSRAGLIIGDRALEQRPNFPYVYDLAEAWQAMTGLPFVFAAWISKKKFGAGFTDRFNKANLFGLERIDQILANNTISFFDLESYYRDHIDFRLDDSKLKAMQLFLQKLK